VKASPTDARRDVTTLGIIRRMTELGTAATTLVEEEEEEEEDDDDDDGGVVCATVVISVVSPKKTLT